MMELDGTQICPTHRYFSTLLQKCLPNKFETNCNMYLLLDIYNKQVYNTISLGNKSYAVKYGSLKNSFSHQAISFSVLAPH
jgi:hypothetical protein